MHSAEHRALRELAAAAGQMARHWRALNGRGLGGGALRAGADDAARLVDEVRALAAARGLAIGPAARTAGASLAGARTGVGDRFLERNQALRLAVLDAAHVALLCDYTRALAAARGGDEELETELARWASRMRDHERVARGTVTDLAAEPDKAIAPADGSPVGRAAHGLANAVGFAGELTDGVLRGPKRR
jgi:hypothetical protein